MYERPIDRVLDAFQIGFLARRRTVQEFWALRDLSLEIAQGERVGIIGRNGAGKSTLLKMIAGTLTPTEGQLEVRGAVQAMLELGTGFHPEFTGRENIHASLAYQGLSKDQIHHQEAEIIDFSELDSFIDQPIKTYSAGMLARLAFSVATSVEPEILIIDEVLGAGDAYFAGKCVERMRKLTEDSGATVLFVSHDLSSVQHLCDRTIWIDRGSVVRQGKPLDVIQAYQTVVRKEDEARLRARDRRVLKQHEFVESDPEVFDRLLFHLVGDGAPLPESGALIKNIALQVGDETVAQIDVGGAMDNDTTRDAYLLYTPGYMDWSEPVRAAQGMAREARDLGGQFHHAPFEFSVPKSYVASTFTPKLIVEADAPDEPVIVEIYDGEKYIKIGALVPGHSGSHEIHFDWLTETEPDHPAAALPIEREYGTGGAEISQVLFLDSSGAESRVLVATQDAAVEIHYNAREELDDPVFVFAAYLPDGRPATQWIARASELGRPVVHGEGFVRFSLNPLRLGRGAYVASAAIFKDLRPDGLEPEAYHLLDRCLHFQVVQPVGDNYEWGLCVQPFTAGFDRSAAHAE